MTVINVQFPGYVPTDPGSDAQSDSERRILRLVDRLGGRWGFAHYDVDTGTEQLDFARSTGGITEELLVRADLARGTAALHLSAARPLRAAGLLRALAGVSSIALLAAAIQLTRALPAAVMLLAALSAFVLPWAVILLAVNRLTRVAREQLTDDFARRVRRVLADPNVGIEPLA